MLTDIFADRYVKRVLWKQFTDVESKLLNQCFRIVSEQLIPYWTDGKENPSTKPKWESLHAQLSMELGVDELSGRYYSYQTEWMGKPITQSGFWTFDKVCKNFVCGTCTDQTGADRFIKERLSFIELAFRLRDEEIQKLNEKLLENISSAELQDKFQEMLRSKEGMRAPGKRVDGIKAFNHTMNVNFQSSVTELNERLRRAGTLLNYHNGFIQVATDALTQVQIEDAFWEVVSNPIWKNVDIDMKESLDRRDANDRDPAFYAARSLESAIKIISDAKGWTHGGEKGAHNYIDNLGATKNGSFIKPWECNALKSFFTEIRNPFGHGPGNAQMPELTQAQTNWAIEDCMSWIKSLVQRL